MKKNIKGIIIPLSLMMLASCGSPVNEHPKTRPTSEDTSSSEVEPKSYRVLYIGNSFTWYNDLDVVTEELGKSAGLDIECERVAISSHKLSEFASDTDEGWLQIEEKINMNDYTHIIMQEHSTTPVGNYSLFLSGATLLMNKLKAKEPDATYRLYQTWGFQNMVDSGYGTTIGECEEALCTAYQNAARTLKIGVHYVGKAFTKWLKENPSVSPYYSGDNKHPSFLGTYLSGLMHLVSITNVNLDSVTYQGEKDHFNPYGETYIDDVNKGKAVEIVKSIYNTFGINY